MLKIWDPVNFRRTVGGLCLILAPVLFAIVEISYPSTGDSGAAQLATAAANHNLMLADIYIGIASSILYIPAVYALLHITRQRGVVLGHIGAILTVLGVALSGLALTGLQLMLWAMAGPGVDQQAMAAFLDKTMQNPAGLPLVMGHVLYALGLIVFGIAIWRSRFGYRWAGPAIAVGIALDVVGGALGLPDLLLAIVSDAIFATALAAIGLRVLLTPDRDWDSGAQPEMRVATAAVAARA